MKTMEKELVLEIFNMVEKAAKALARAGESWCPEEERCVDALSRLKGLEIPREVVLNSKMGKRLFRLKHHPSERIKELSGDVVDAMKSALFRQHYSSSTPKIGQRKMKTIADHGRESDVPVILALAAPTIGVFSKKQQRRPATN